MADFVVSQLALTTVHLLDVLGRVVHGASVPLKSTQGFRRVLTLIHLLLEVVPFRWCPATVQCGD